MLQSEIVAKDGKGPVSLKKSLSHARLKNFSAKIHVSKGLPLRKKMNYFCMFGNFCMVDDSEENKGMFVFQFLYIEIQAA